MVELLDYIDPWMGFGVNDLQDALNGDLKDAKKIKLLIHSNGGNALEGFAIYGLLRNHPARIEAEIIGVAASAASTVAMAADHIKISELGFVMIHDPWTCGIGNSAVMRRVADMLDKIQPSIVKSYLRHAKISAEELAAAMSEGDGAGTWYDAEAAVAAGLAHEIMAGVEVPENRIDFGHFKNVPKAAMATFCPPKQPESQEPNNELDALLELLQSSPKTPQTPTSANKFDELQALVQQFHEEELATHV